MGTAVAPFQVEKIRQEFPILTRQIGGKPLVYFDNASTSQKPESVLDRMDRFYREEYANVHRGVHSLSQAATEAYEEARASVSRLLHARETREIIFTKGGTESINLVAESFGRARLKPGDTILLSALEHHSNIVPWQLIAGQVGAEIKVIPMNDEGVLDLDIYWQLLLKEPKIVALQHVSNAIGVIHPIKQMIDMAHHVDATVLIDGAQGGPHLKVDVQDLNADFYTLSPHKMYAPSGVGVLYGKARLLERMRPYQGGGSMIRTVSFEKTTYAEIPEKFEAGTPNIAGAVGLGEAAEWFMKLDREAAEAHEASLVRHAFDLLTAIPGVRVLGPRENNAGIVSFVMADAHPHDIGTVLDSEGIAIRAGHHCCMPLMRRLGVPATARASFAVYNTHEEVEALARAVQKTQEMFA